MKNIKKNALANLLVKFLNIAFPLITGPYIARILNKDLYGFFNDASTYTYLFVPIAGFGIYNYGMRTISKIKDDSEKINQTFSKLFYISCISSMFAGIFYLIFIHLFVDMNGLELMYYILGLQIFTQFLSIEWVNEAFENYSFILYKTIIIRILMLISIFTFVKQSQDIIPYSIIMTAMTILNFLISFIAIKKNITFVKPSFSQITTILASLIAVLLLSNSNMLYTFLDRLFLANTDTPAFISYYTISQNIVTLIANTILGAISVSVPRLGYYLGKKDFTSYQNLVYKGNQLLSLLIIPMSIGLTLLGNQATLLYAGEQYLEAGIVTVIFAIRNIFIALEIILGTQIIFVNGYEKHLTFIYLTGGLLNLGFNSILFSNHLYRPEYYLMTTVLAEIVVIILEIFFIKTKKMIQFNLIITQNIKYFLLSLGFIPIYFIINHIYPYQAVVNKTLMLNVVLTIFSCILYYALALLIVKDNIFYGVLRQIKTYIKK